MSDKCKLGKVDLSQIECRILNTLAGQWDVVEKFRTGLDIYSELATQFYGFPVDKSKPAERGTGKQLELSCGYGAGGTTIVRTARAGTYGPPVHLTDSQGLQARDLYRGTHPFVVALWERAGQILWTLLAGHTMEWGPPGQPEPCMTIYDHRIFGPGGTWLDFTSLKRERLESGEEVWAMVRILEMGYRIPLTVHDDCYILIPNDEYAQAAFDKLAVIVAQPLVWMPACPIAVEAELLDALEKA